MNDVRLDDDGTEPLRRAIDDDHERRSEHGDLAIRDMIPHRVPESVVSGIAVERAADEVRELEDLQRGRPVAGARGDCGEEQNDGSSASEGASPASLAATLGGASHRVRWTRDRVGGSQARRAKLRLRHGSRREGRRVLELCCGSCGPAAISALRSVCHRRHVRPREVLPREEQRLTRRHRDTIRKAVAVVQHPR